MRPYAKTGIPGFDGGTRMWKNFRVNCTRQIIPCAVGQERVGFDGVVGTRAQSAEAGDDEVAERRVVVILAALLV